MTFAFRHGQGCAARSGGQAVLIALLGAGPTLLHEPCGALIGDFAEIGVRLRLQNGGLELLELAFSLSELRVEIGRGDDCEHIALFHLAADIDIAFRNIASRPGEKRRLVEGSHIAGQFDRPRA